MKPAERFPPDDPREWLNRARSSLKMAKNRVPSSLELSHLDGKDLHSYIYGHRPLGNATARQEMTKQVELEPAQKMR